MDFRHSVFYFYTAKPPRSVVFTFHLMELTKQTLNGICTRRDSPEFKQPDQSFNSCSVSAALQKEDIHHLLND